MRPLAAHTVSSSTQPISLSHGTGSGLRPSITQERARAVAVRPADHSRTAARASAGTARVVLGVPAARRGARQSAVRKSCAAAGAVGRSIGKALRSATRRAGAASPAPVSPILAALRAAAADPDFDPRVAKRRLVLISDLLENDPAGYSAYRPMGEADLARATARPAALTDVIRTRHNPGSPGGLRASGCRARNTVDKLLQRQRRARCRVGPSG